MEDYGSISPWEPGYVDRFRFGLMDLLKEIGVENYRAGDVAGRATGLLDFAPLVGDVKGVADTADSYSQGDMLGAGINGVATAVGLLPLFGDVAAKGIKALPNPESARKVNMATREKAWQDLERATKSAGVKQTKSGRYVGGPKDVLSPQKRAPIVKKYVDRTNAAIDAGIPPGYFYEEGRGILSRITDTPAEHEMVSRLYGPTSTQVGPYDNSNYVIRALDQQAAGVPTSVTLYPNAQRAKVDSVMNNEAPFGGYKIDRYSYNLGPMDEHVNMLETMPPNDQWEGYGTGFDKGYVPSGPAQVAWSDDIRRRAADKINAKRAAEGLSPLTLPEVQELHWAAIRAESDGRPLVLGPKDTLQGSLPSFRVQHGWEAEPGDAAGMQRMISKQDYADQFADVLIDDQGKDRLIRSMGGRLQEPVVRGPGVWKGEVNPGFQSSSFGSHTASRGLEDASKARIDSTEAVRQYMLGQEGRGYSLLQEAGKDNNIADFITDSPLSEPEALRIQQILGENGFVAPTPDGYRVVVFDGKVADYDLPGPSRVGRNLGDGRSMDWEGGNATSGLLEALGSSGMPGPIRHADSEQTRQIAGEVADLYSRLEADGQLKPNQKLVNALKVWKSEGIAGLRELVRQGLAPAAVLSLGGLSAMDERGQPDA